MSEVIIKTCWENKGNGQILITLPKDKFKAGDVVLVKKSEETLKKNKLEMATNNNLEKIERFYKIQLNRLKTYEEAGRIHESARIESECLSSTLESLKGFFPELKKLEDL